MRALNASQSSSRIEQAKWNVCDEVQVCGNPVQPCLSQLKSVLFNYKNACGNYCQIFWLSKCPANSKWTCVQAMPLMRLFIFTYERSLILWGSWQGINHTACLLPAREELWLFPLQMQWNCTTVCVSRAVRDAKDSSFLSRLAAAIVLDSGALQHMMSQQCIQCLCLSPTSSFLWLGWVWPGLHRIQRRDCGVFKTSLFSSWSALFWFTSVKINVQSSSMRERDSSKPIT